MKMTNEKASTILAIIIMFFVIFSCEYSPEFQARKPLEDYQVEQIMTEARIIINSRADARQLGFNECRDNLFGCLMCHENMHRRPVE